MRVIELTKGQVAIVDDENFDKLAQWRWNCSAQGYACRSINYYKPCGKKACRDEKMHHAVMGRPEPGFVSDHINGNRLDNRRENLRWATRGQNKMNSRPHRGTMTGVKGVSITNRRKPDMAYISFNKKRKHLGYFSTIEEASAAYYSAAQKLFGEFARQN